MLTAIHQSHYLPWLRYFHKMACSDRFVVLDDVQYEKNGFQNRNKIKTAQGWSYLTVPVLKPAGQSIREVEIDHHSNWREKHRRAIEMSYRRAPYFERYWPELSALYEREWTHLAALNREMLKLFLRQLDISTPVVYSSELPTRSRATERLAELCRAVGGDTYVSGRYALQSYLDPCVLEAAGISLAFQEWQAPIYPQLYPAAGFVADLAIVDLLFNEGPRAREILVSSGGVTPSKMASGLISPGLKPGSVRTKPTFVGSGAVESATADFVRTDPGFNPGDINPEDQIPHSRPTLPSAEEWAEVTGRLAPGWIADGPCVEAFARQAAEWLGGAAGVAVNSGTSALHLALLAAGVTPGSEVLIPSYSCAALLNAVYLAGAVPVLVDAEPGGFNLWADDARRRLTSRTKALVVAHLFGRPAVLAPLLDLGVPVIEDCAQAFGAVVDGVPIGSRGALAISSFYATKVITTGQGGLVSSRETGLAVVAQDRVHYDGRDDDCPRFNYRMSELQAALGLWQLERLPAFLARRQALAGHYDEQLGLPGGAPAADAGIPYRYLLRVADASGMIQALQVRGIDARRPVYRPLHHALGGDYPNAQSAHEQLVSLPLYPALTDAEAERVVAAVRAVIAPVRRSPECLSCR